MLSGQDKNVFNAVDTGVLAANGAIGPPFSLDHALHAMLQLVVTTISGAGASVTPKLQGSADGANWVDLPLALYAGGADWTAITAAGAQAKFLQDLPIGSLRLVAGAVAGTTPRLNSVSLFAHLREEGR